MSAQALLLLEERVSHLENAVFGAQTTRTTSEISIAEMLVNSQTMITSALTCRDNIAKVLQRLPELNNFLNPMHLDNALEIEAKKQYIVLLYTEMKHLGQLVQKFNRLGKFLDSDAIAKVGTMDEKLKQSVGCIVNAHLDSLQSTKEVNSTVGKYNGIISSLEMLFMQFDKSLSELEAAMYARKGRFNV